MSKHQISHHRIDGNLDSTPGSTRSDFRGHFEGREPCKPAQPVQPEVVTHVSGTFCHPCVRVGHPLWLAEREGFEPPIRLPVCRISSAVLSTTQPPLRKWQRRITRLGKRAI